MFLRSIHAGAAIFAGITILSASCARKTSARVPAGPSVPAATAKIGSTESGIASWYGIPYHGRRAASGEVYDMEQLTAAHRTLPFNTWLEVTNLANGKTIDVRVNDRGPFVDGRIIDLSQAAARAIDMLRSGV
jgi:peptidoglycan lytic transglycosylase